ncbi:hypothetical protein Tco_1089555 [Tanacetum coccineum]
MATEFNREEFEKMEEPVIFAISSYKSNVYGGIQLSGTLATYYYFNLEIPGLEELREQYRQRLNLNPPLQISKERCSDINAEKNRNRFPLNTLLQQNPDGYRVHFQGIAERPVGYRFDHLFFTKYRRVDGKQLH